MLWLTNVLPPMALAPTILASALAVAPMMIAPMAPLTPPAAPAATIESRCAPETLDLGEMQVGQPKTMPYTVTNSGTAPITVESIKGGCGCTTVSAPPKDPIAPGASFTVQVTVDPGKRGGIDLVKPLYVAFAGGRVESAQIKGRVNAVATATPSKIDAADAASTTKSVTVESVDGKAFRVTGVAPAGILTVPKDAAAAARIELTFSRDAWERAGKPSSLVISTDLSGVAEIVVPVKSAQSVSMFRLPPAAGEGAARAESETAQAGIIARIDSDLDADARSPEFRMRLHRESGMLFVHGSDAEVDAVRRAVRALPASMGVRESHPTQDD